MTSTAPRSVVGATILKRSLQGRMLSLGSGLGWPAESFSLNQRRPSALMVIEQIQ